MPARVLLLLWLLLTVTACSNDPYDGHSSIPLTAEPTTWGSFGNASDIQVLFVYSCIHCYHLESVIEDSKARIERIHIMVPPSHSAYNLWRPMAEAFYAAQLTPHATAINQTIFDRFHNSKQPPKTRDDFAQLFGQFDLSQTQYRELVGSEEVETALRDAANLTRELALTKTPMVISQQRYLINYGLLGPKGALAEAIAVLSTSLPENAMQQGDTL